MADTANQSIDSALLIWLWLLVPIIGLYWLGVWAGVKQRIVVYRNYHDLMIVGMLYMVPVMAMGAAAFLGAGPDNPLAFWLLVITVVLEVLLLLFILVRTWIDNPNPLKMLLALYVKMPTGVLFFMKFFDIFGNKQARGRRKSMFWALFTLPLLHALVADKKTGKMPLTGRRTR